MMMKNRRRQWIGEVVEHKSYQHARQTSTRTSKRRWGGIIAKATKLGVNLSRMNFACNMTPGKLVPPSMCATVTIFGKCDNRKCKRKHVTPTDDQAKNIIQMMEPLILDPTKLPKGKFT